MDAKNALSAQISRRLSTRKSISITSQSHTAHSRVGSDQKLGWQRSRICSLAKKICFEMSNTLLAHSFYQWVNANRNDNLKMASLFTFAAWYSSIAFGAYSLFFGLLALTAPSPGGTPMWADRRVGVGHLSAKAVMQACTSHPRPCRARCVLERLDCQDVQAGGSADATVNPYVRIRRARARSEHGLFSGAFGGGGAQVVRQRPPVNREYSG
jgi:hypothetical protein